MGRAGRVLQLRRNYRQRGWTFLRCRSPVFIVAIKQAAIGLESYATRRIAKPAHGTCPPKHSFPVEGTLMSFQSEGVVGHELHHLRLHWWWLLLLGVLLVACGTATIVFPYVTVFTSVAIVTFIGVMLLVGGAATIVGAFWAGRWSGLLLQLLVGILYTVSGLVLIDHPVAGELAFTVFIAASFIVLGLFRLVAALMLQFPQWGWAALNGAVTFLAGVVIFKQLPEAAFWFIGLLIGLEMLFNGWMWIMLSMALRGLPEGPARSSAPAHVG
jgi:uncharacterized membrane protein HdeD (DUF308 family)